MYWLQWHYQKDSARHSTLSFTSDQGWLDIYRRYISLIYIGYISDIFVRKYQIFRYFQFLWSILIFKCDTLWLCFDFQSVHFASLWLVPSAFSQCWKTSVRLHLSTAMQYWQTTRRYIVLFRSKFHIILAIYVQMLNIYIYIENMKKNRIFSIFSKISRYFPALPVMEATSMLITRWQYRKLSQLSGHWSSTSIECLQLST